MWKMPNLKPKAPTPEDEAEKKIRLNELAQQSPIPVPVVDDESPTLQLPVYTGDLTDEELLAEQKKIDETIMRSFPSEFVGVLKLLAYYLSTIGLDFKEACMMIRFDPKDMEKKIKEFPIIQELINIKELLYKADLIKAVSKKALSGDEKLAQWLLERRFPHEFNPKKGTGIPSDNGNDLLAAAVEFIQKSDDVNPLVHETSGRAFLIKKNSGENIISQINQVLK